MTALEYMERQAQSNRINYNRQVLRNAPEQDLQNIKRNIGYYEEAVEALKVKREIIVDALNKVIEEAISHGGDAGGAYYSNDIGLFAAMTQFALIFGLDVWSDGYVPVFRMPEPPKEGAEG